MTPRERVQDLYHIYPQPRTFEEDVAIHRLTGFVVEREDIFLLGRGVIKGMDELARDPGIAFRRDVQDAWFIHALAGDIRGMLTAAPYELPWVGWSRRGARPIRWYRCEDFSRRVAGFTVVITSNT